MQLFLQLSLSFGSHSLLHACYLSLSLSGFHSLFLFYSPHGSDLMSLPQAQAFCANTFYGTYLYYSLYYSDLFTYLLLPLEARLLAAWVQGVCLNEW